MRLVTSIIFILAILAQSSVSEACGSQDWKVSEAWHVPNYEVYHQLKQDEPFADFSNIDVVRVNKEKIDPDKDIQEIEFEIIESLKGNSDLNFKYIAGESDRDNSLFWDKPEGKLVPQKAAIKPKYQTIDNVMQRRLWQHTQPAFYDSFFMAPPRENPTFDPAFAPGMCMESATPYVNPNWLYLVFRTENYSKFIEPIRGTDDALVRVVKDILGTGTSDRMKVSFQNFLERQSFQILEIDYCPTGNLEHIEPKNNSKFFKDYISERKISVRKKDPITVLVDKVHQKPTFTINASNQKLKRIESYFKHILGKEFKCSAGDLYLAIPSNLIDPRHTYPLYIDKYEMQSWRYLKIVDDQIDVEEFVTNLEITGPKQINLKDLPLR